MSKVPCKLCPRSFRSAKALNAHMVVHRRDYPAIKAGVLLKKLRGQIADFLKEPAVKPGETVPEELMTAVFTARNLLDEELDRRISPCAKS